MTPARADFQRAYRRFLTAEGGRHRTVESWCRIAGFPIRLRFTSHDVAAAVGPAFAHLVCSPAAIPSLTVCLWDNAWASSPTGDNHDHAGPAAVVGAGKSGTRSARVNESMSLLTADRTLALEWVPDATKLTVAQRAAPFHQLLHGWLTEQDVHLVHGGAVGTLGGAALLAGPGGAGKSTTALACLLAGLDYLGDDYVLLSDQPAPTVHSLYSSGKLDPGHARALPGLRSLVDNTTKVPGEKAVWFLYHHFPDQVRAALPLKVVLAPQIVDGSASRAVEISPAAGLRALAPSSILLHPGPGQTALRALSRVLRAVPSFRLELGRDLTAIPDVVANLLAQL